MADAAPGKKPYFESQKDRELYFFNIFMFDLFTIIKKIALASYAQYNTLFISEANP